MANVIDLAESDDDAVASAAVDVSAPGHAPEWTRSLQEGAPVSYRHTAAIGSFQGWTADGRMKVEYDGISRHERVGTLEAPPDGRSRCRRARPRHASAATADAPPTATATPPTAPALSLIHI